MADFLVEELGLAEIEGLVLGDFYTWGGFDFQGGGLDGNDSGDLAFLLAKGFVSLILWDQKWKWTAVL